MTTPTTRRATLDDIKFKPASIRPPQSTLTNELPDAAAWSALLGRVRREFHEMPGLSLTLPQASRLFGLPETTCSLVLLHLVEGGLLCVRGDGRYALKASAA